MLRRQSALFLLPGLLLLSCAAPFLERAVDPPGTFQGLGLMVSAGETRDVFSYPEQPFVVVAPTANVRQNMTDRLSLSLQGAAGVGFLRNIDDRSLYANFAAGTKWRVGSEGAIKMTLGVDYFKGLTPVAYVTAMHDFGDFTTFTASLGFPVIAGLAVTLHPRLSKDIVSHVSFSSAGVLNGALGFGIDIVAPELPDE